MLVASKLVLEIKFDQIFSLALLKSGISFAVAYRLVLVKSLPNFKRDSFSVHIVVLKDWFTAISSSLF